MNIHIVTRSKHPLAGLAVMLAASMGIAPAVAATPVTRVYVVQVPAAQDQAFNAGVKSWEKCLRSHGNRQVTYAYDAQTGDLSRYLFLNPYRDWAAMDAQNPADNPCRGTFRSAVLPHVGHAFSEVAVLSANESYMPGGDPDPAPIMWVAAFRVKFGQMALFNDTMAKIATAAAKIHWAAHYDGWDIEGSGQGGEDFVLVWPNKSWADVGEDPTPSMKDMMYRVYGETAAQAIRQNFNAAVAEFWAEGWRYDKDLSLIPAK
jgi:hypothetical protein